MADRGCTFTFAFTVSGTIKVLVIIPAPVGFSVIVAKSHYNKVANDYKK